MTGKAAPGKRPDLTSATQRRTKSPTTAGRLGLPDSLLEGIGYAEAHLDSINVLIEHWAGRPLTEEEFNEVMREGRERFLASRAPVVESLEPRQNEFRGYA
jgi:hypothetical protein